MATRHDSGSNAAHENQRPASHNEDAIPEMDDTETRAMAEDEDDEFEDTEDLDDESEETEDSDI